MRIDIVIRSQKKRLISETFIYDKAYIIICEDAYSKSLNVKGYKMIKGKAS